MPAPDPLDALSKSIANLSSGQYTPTTNSTTASSGLSPDQQIWHVYLGPHGGMKPDKSLGRFFEPGGMVEHQNIVTTDIAMGQFYGWSDAKRKKWGETLQAAGVIAPGDFSWDSLEGWWQKAVTAAGNIKTLGGQNITPEQWVQTRAAGVDVGATAGGTGAAKTTTFTQKTIPYQDPAALRDLIRSSLADKLGRSPDDSEMDDMMDIARTYESSHPSVTKQTTTTDAKGNTNQTSRTVQPGVSAAGYKESVDNAAMKNPEYGAYQAAGPLFNALISAIQAPVNV